MTAGDGLFRRMLRNAGLMLGGKAVTALVNLGATAIALRTLGVHDYGLLILMHALVQTAGGIVKFQSWQAVLRYGAPCLERGDKPAFRALLRFTAGLDLGSALAGMLLCAVAAYAFGSAFGWGPELAPAAALYSTAVAFRVMATATGLLRLFDRFDLLAKRDAVGAAVRLAGGLAAAAAGGGLLAFLLVWYAGAAAGGLALVLAAWQELRRRGLTGPVPGPAVRATVAHPGIWNFAWTTNLTTTLGLASTQLGTLAAGALLGPAEAALYAIGRQIGDSIMRPSQFLTPAIYPELARLVAAGDAARARGLVLRALRLSAIGAAVMLVALELLGAPLLRLIGGAAAVPAHGIAMLLALAGAIGFAGFAMEPVLMSTGRQGAALRARAAGVLVFVPAALLGTWLAGLTGAGLASIIAALVTLVCQALPASRWLQRAAAAQTTVPASPPTLAAVGAEPGA
jgi:O-antigen/teichoic acid export membrane protein